MYEALDESYIGLLIDNIVADNLKRGYDLTRINEWYSTLHSPKGVLDMCYLEYRPYHTLPIIYTLCPDIALESPGIPSAQNNSNFDLRWGK